MINCEYNKEEKRWDFMYVDREGKSSSVYLKDDLQDIYKMQSIVTWVNRIIEHERTWLNTLLIS